MAGAPSDQPNSKLGGPKGDLYGKFLGHLHVPWEPLGSKELLTEVRGTLHEYIQRFSKQCNELPNVANANIIGAFLSRMACESLVH